MARLNEPAVESIDSLKRRFVRQNRELARNNSIQSVKIRNLELEVSRLLTENLDLRTQTIQLNAEIYDASSKQVIEDVEAIRTQLELKVAEFAGMLTEMGTIGKRPGRRRMSTSSARHITERPTSAVLDCRSCDEKLPTIVEGKYFPRKTLENHDIRSLLSEAASDSPDLGPPPRTFFDRDDAAIVHDATNVDVGVVHDSLEQVPGLLSANFETRRRRRDPQRRSGPVQLDALVGPPAKPNHVHLAELEPLRAESSGQPSTKRKLETKEQQTPVLNRVCSENDAFIFSRKEEPLLPLLEVLGSEKTNKNSPFFRAPNDKDVPSARKALAAKNTNFGPASSPRKLHDSKTSLEPPIRRRQTHNLANRMHPNNQATPEVHNIPSIPPPNLPPTTDIPPPLHEIKAEPLTPGPLTLFSPTSTESSEVTRPLRDTPPPSIRRAPSISSIDDVLPMRPSRRTRPAVSYAEPSLNSKLRRPTDTLVDAVGRSDRRSGVMQHAHGGTADRPVHIKEEPLLEQQPHATTVDVVSAQPSSPSPSSSSALHSALSEATDEAQHGQLRKRGPLTSSAAIAARTAKPAPPPVQPVRSSGRQRTPQNDGASPPPMEEAHPASAGHGAAAATTAAQPSHAGATRNVRARASARRQTLVLRELDAADVGVLVASPNHGGGDGGGANGGGGGSAARMEARTGREVGVRRRASLAH